MGKPDEEVGIGYRIRQDPRCDAALGHDIERQIQILVVRVAYRRSIHHLAWNPRLEQATLDPVVGRLFVVQRMAGFRAMHEEEAWPSLGPSPLRILRDEAAAFLFQVRRRSSDQAPVGQPGAKSAFRSLVPESSMPEALDERPHSFGLPGRTDRYELDVLPIAIEGAVVRDAFPYVRLVPVHAKLDHGFGIFVDTQRRRTVVTPGEMKRSGRELYARLADPERKDTVRKIVHEILHPFRAQTSRPRHEAHPGASDLARQIVVDPAFTEQAVDRLVRKLRDDALSGDQLFLPIVRQEYSASAAFEGYETSPFPALPSCNAPKTHQLAGIDKRLQRGCGEHASHRHGHVHQEVPKTEMLAELEDDCGINPDDSGDGFRSRMDDAPAVRHERPVAKPVDEPAVGGKTLLQGHKEIEAAGGIARVDRPEPGNRIQVCELARFGLD